METGALLREVCHSMGSRAVHDKAIGVLPKSLEAVRWDDKAGNLIWFELKADNRCFLYNRNKLVIPRTEFCDDNRWFPAFPKEAFAVRQADQET